MKRILHIEDDLDIRELVKSVLEMSGYSVQGASCAKEGFSLLEDLEFDLVLLDMMLPGLSGLEILERIRGDPRHDGLRAAFLSVLSDSGLDLDGLGVSGYIEKPFTNQDLVKQVSKILNR